MSDLSTNLKNKARDWLNFLRNIDRWVDFLWGVIAIATPFYLYAMFLRPILDGWSQGCWSSLSRVLYQWQSLNVGILAFFSSVIFFKATRYSEEKQRERNFMAAKALLPYALSKLCEHIEECADNISGRSSFTECDKTIITTFKDCIKHSTPEVGRYLCKILNLLQVSDARFKSDPSQNNESVTLHLLIPLVELRVLIDEIFGFSRNEEPFCENKIVPYQAITSAFKLTFHPSVLDIDNPIVQRAVDVVALKFKTSIPKY